jgi:uncharacterized protein involved in exopolysaccharide biosynthesis
MNKPNHSSMQLRHLPALRDWAAIGFRHARLIAFSFVVVFVAAVLVVRMMPRQYEAQIKILVKRERVDPVVTAEQTTQNIAPEFTEQDLNSEVELLKSRDLLEKVAVASGMALADRAEIFRAAQTLQKDLKVEPLKKTKLIKVTYRSSSPYQAAKVLQTLTRLYLDKHMEVHRPAGALDFFQARAEEYRKGLKNAEQQLARFDTENGVVTPELEKEITVRKLSEFESEVRQTRAAMTETEQRIHALEGQQASTPARSTTQVRTLDNALLLQQMKSTLLNLELKRTELLSKFAPDYRPVQDIEAQIAQTREALANAEKNQMREETTDRDTTHEWLTAELAKARAELSALQGRFTATSQIVDAYRAQVRRLNEKQIAQEELIRSAKSAEQNFLLYSQKQEEARISDAMDRQRIFNVSIAEAATVPAVPTGPGGLLTVALAALLASLVSASLALAVDYTDRSFRTPEEVERFLGVPVLASLPQAPTPVPARTSPSLLSHLKQTIRGASYTRGTVSEVVTK